MLCGHFGHAHSPDVPWHPRRERRLETICLLLCYKIKYPENFFLLRGNREASPINRLYGFYDECAFVALHLALLWFCAWGVRASLLRPCTLLLNSTRGGTGARFARRSHVNSP